MSLFLTFWIATGLIFLIIEMLTATFYGLAIALASFLVAGYVAISGEGSFSILQGIIFVIGSGVFSISFPYFFRGSGMRDIKQGLDQYIGRRVPVKYIGSQYKITLDGIEYLIDIDFAKDGDIIEITHRDGAIFYGKNLS